MRFKFTRLHPNDQTRYFQGTIVRLCPPNANPRWAWFEGIQPDGRYAFNLGEKKSKKTWMFVEHKAIGEYEIDVIFPVGFFNTKTSAVYCQRRGARIANKGLYPGHNYITSPVETMVTDWVECSGGTALGLQLSARMSTLTPEQANFMFEGMGYASLEESVLQIRKGKVFARALNRDVAIAPHFANRDFLVLYREYPAAEFFSKTMKLKVLVKDFLPELKEYFEPQGAKIING